MILVSACLAGEACRMDGQSKGIEAIRKLVEEGKAVTVCPEVLGGLSIPRDPAERVGERIITCKGRDVTEAYQKGAEKSLEIFLREGCEYAVLKSRSPSCGLGLIHNGKFDGGMTEGNGVFVSLLQEKGIRVMDEHMFLEEMRRETK